MTQTGSDRIDDFVDEDKVLTEDIKYDITSYGADFLVDGLVDRFSEGEIYVPDFQRSFVWSRPQASRFIESLLMGIPVPSVFLYREKETNKFLVVDGLQRLSALLAFTTGSWPGSDRKFRLEKVIKKYVGKLFEDLEEDDKRQILNTVLHATVFQQNLPQDTTDEKWSVYLIFERLNTGGTPLQPQEIRSALYHGPFVHFLRRTNKVESWRKLYGGISKRKKDEELVLRFLALHEAFEGYESPMERFLNSFMSRNRNLDEDDAVTMRRIFQRTTSYIEEALGKHAFRPKKNLNAAVFDSVSVAVARLALYENMSKAAFVKRYERLLNDQLYVDAVSKSTSDARNVKTRIQRALQAFS